MHFEASHRIAVTYTLVSDSGTNDLNSALLRLAVTDRGEKLDGLKIQLKK